MTKTEAATQYRTLRNQSTDSAASFDHACYMLLSDDGEMFADGPVPGFTGFTGAHYAAAAEHVLQNEARRARAAAARARRVAELGPSYA